MTRGAAVLAAVVLAGGLILPARVAAQTAPPALEGPVNDFAGIIDGDSTRALDDLSRRLQQATGDVLVVATVKTYQPWADLPSYAVQMFENGGKGVGAKGNDNGLLIVLALDERQVRIEVGYGLEGVITDGFAGETSRDTMVPYFRRGDYGGGLLAGATRVAQRIAEDRHVDLGGAAVRPPARRDGSGGFPVGLIIFILILLVNLIGRTRRRRRGVSPFWMSGVGGFGNHNRWGGGGGWSGGGGFGGGFGGFGGGRSGGGGGGAGW